MQPGLGERAEDRAEEGDRDDRRDGADAGPARRADEVPAVLVRTHDPVAQPLAHAARPPGDQRRVAAAPGLDQRRPGVAHLEGLARAEDVIVGIAAAGEPDAAGQDRHLATAGAERDDVAGRQGTHRLGVDRTQERGGGLLRIHHDDPCID